MSNIDWTKVTKVYKGLEVAGKIYDGYTEVYDPEPTPTPVVDRNYLCFQNVEAVNNTITLERQGEPTFQVTCEYTKDGENWTVMNLTPDANGVCDSIVLQPNEKVWLRGTGTWEMESVEGVWSQYYFQSTGLLDMSGNVLSIYDKTNFDTMTEMPKNTNMRLLLKYGNTQTYEGWSFLKVRKADLSFDNITKVEQINATKPNKCVISSLFGYTTNVPNTYLQSCKISFNSSIVINRLAGSSYQYSPFGSFFAGCTNLTEIWLPYWTSTGTFNQNKFTDGVSSTGTVYLAQSNTIGSGANGVPTTWTKVYYDPATGQIIE